MATIDLPPRYANILDTLTPGGMSEAYVCHDKHLDRKVVVKKLKSGIEKRRIIDELGALLAIRSKYVVEIYDIISDKGGNIIAIVEEFIPGENLSSIKPPDSLERALRIIYPIAAGIADIHQHDRVHRDIKPDNMKFDAEGCLKIFDFGLSRIDGIDSDTKNLAFTQGYAAPELFKSSAGKVSFTRSVDTFAFGSTVYQLLAGTLPKGLLALPPSLPCPDLDFSKLTIGLPAELCKCLDGCFSENPAARPTMAAVRDLIGRYLLRNKHRALLVSEQGVVVLDKDTIEAKLSAENLGEIIIEYDSFCFKIKSCAGEVFINNMRAMAGQVLPGSCVIVIGPPELRRGRVMVTMDVSHPEVML